MMSTHKNKSKGRAHSHYFNVSYAKAQTRKALKRDDSRRARRAERREIKEWEGSI